MTSATALATKAHQLLSKGDVGEAVFAANCVEEVVKVPSLTKQELGVLSVLFLKILDRIFGEDVTSPPETTASSASAAATATSSWVKGSPGGWMRALGLQNSTYGDISNLPHSGVKLLKHFLPGQPIFGLLQEISSEFAVTLLPPKLQMLLSNHYLYRVVSSPSHNRILQLLHYPVSFDRNNVVKLDATEYFIFCLTRFPALYNHLSPFANFMSPGGQSSSMLNNSTSCPYFGPPSVVLRSRGIYAWTGTLPYLAVLLAYLREFFPHMRTSEISSNASQQSMVIQQSKTKELFLRIAVEYWANSAYVVHVEFNQLSAYRRQLYTTSPLLVAGQCLDGDLPRGHPPLHEAILLNGYGSVKFTLAGCQGLYMMLFSVLSDPQLRNQLLSADVSQSSADSSAGILLQILQCPLFDMIRCVFQK